VDWIHLAQSGNQWRAIGNMVMNRQVSQLAGNFFHYLRKCILAS